MILSTDSTGLTLSDAQRQVDRWITTVGNGYFSPLTNMAVLIEEVGEVARIISRTYGEQVPKHDDMGSLSDELADVLWVLMALANQCGVNLSDAFTANITKKSLRDAGRFKPEN